MKFDWNEFVRKVASRKFWTMLVGFVGGLILAFGGGENTVALVGGLLMAGGGLIAYLLGETWVDVERVRAARWRRDGWRSDV